MEYLLMMERASLLLVGFATVGPEAIASNELPSPSDRIRLITVPGQARVNPPPLISSRDLRRVLISEIAAPDRIKSEVRFCNSASFRSFTGTQAKADPPPEIRQMRVSETPTFNANS